VSLVATSVWLAIAQLIKMASIGTSNQMLPRRDERTACAV
jgi:hypothetical protein